MLDFSIERLVFSVLQRTLSMQRPELFYGKVVYDDIYEIWKKDEVLGAFLDPKTSNLKSVLHRDVFFSEIQ